MSTTIPKAVAPILMLGMSMIILSCDVAEPTGGKAPDWLQTAGTSLESELVAEHGESVRPRLHRGLEQMAKFWRASDGDEQAFRDFVRANFPADKSTLDTMFTRLEWLLEQLDGHMVEISRQFRTQADLDLGPILPLDELFAGYDPSAHVLDDFFKNKLAFVILLNFPLTTLEERLEAGRSWTRRQWAEARLAQKFSKRIPADVSLALGETGAEVDQYIAEYNIWMHHLIDDKGTRLFPPKLRLLSHWNLRDEIKANYGDLENGIAKQRMIQKVMERIVTQTIPGVVVNNPHVDWNPYANTVTPAGLSDVDAPPPPDLEPDNSPEPDTRYAMWLETYKVSRMVDPYSPTTPTLIARQFDENREIPEERVKAMLEQVVSSPLAAEVATLIEERLGRSLEPFDIWYNGFRQRGPYSEAELDAMVASRYPDAEAFHRNIPNLLVGLGFSRSRAAWLADNIMVDPARGSGHAWGSAMRSAPARLRTRIGGNGMDYKGFNIAVHELGHNVEQVISLHDVDFTLLQGVPNTAFTEALAFVFQAQDMKLLGLAEPDAKGEALKVLDDFWGTFEIAGVSLIDMDVWHWMYDHPDATPAQLKEAVLGIARDIWNKYYAPVLKTDDVVLLAVYSHMIHSFLYLPDYPIGHLIGHQIEEKMKNAGSIGPEFDRIARIGNVAPDLWMNEATGAPVGPEALLTATEHALQELKR
ncbi:MAG: hypothetical protein WBG01_06645 [Bacteroidota bacterium]